MNILCKIFGHSIRLYLSGITGITEPSYCKRQRCTYKEEGITWERPQMPKTKPSKNNKE